MHGETEGGKKKSGIFYVLVTDYLQHDESLLITVCIILFKNKLDALAYIIQSGVQWILGEKVGVSKFASETRRKWRVLPYWCQNNHKNMPVVNISLLGFYFPI